MDSTFKDVFLDLPAGEEDNDRVSCLGKARRRDSTLDACLDPYVYWSLEARSHTFRLLTLQPGERDDIVRCTLHKADLSESPCYETISYCWGDLKERSSLFLDGQLTSAPANSVAALRRMRRPDIARVLFCDAVCIDQANIRERGHQVGLMRQIYSCSSGNLIDFGDDDAFTRVAYDILAIEDEMRRDTNNFKDLRSLIYNESGHRKFSNEPIRFPIKLDSLWRFFAHPWFSRLWVMPEAILAPKNTCYCAGILVDLTKILRVCLWIAYKHRPLNTGRIPPSINHATRLWEYVDPDHGAKHHTKPDRGATLAEMLSLSRQLDAFDARDRVFACLGTLRYSIRSHGPPAALLPDYTRSVESVFTDATRLAISESGVRAVFSNVSHRSMDELQGSQWPSWIPRWTRPMDPTIDPQSFVTCHLPHNDVTCIHTDTESCNLTLSVVGNRIDLTQYVTAEFPLDARRANFQNLDTWLQDLGLVYGNARNLAHSDYSHDKAISMALIGGQNADWHTATDVDFAGLSELQGYLRRERALPPLIKNVPKHPKRQGERAASRYMYSLIKACEHRRCFFTVSGGYFGVGPRTMACGDTVVTFDRGGSFHILRSEDAYYRLVGECYVSSLALNEVVPLGRTMLGPEEIIKLK